MVGYEHIEPAVGTNRSSASSSNTGAVSAANGREAMYQDLMSTITAAAAANQLSLSSSTPSNTLTTTTSATTAVSKPATQAPANPSTAADSKSQSSKAKSVQIYDEDEYDLNAKLCTYTVTKKEFKNQHWYYCRTCKMVDRIGVCTICAKVCHKDHDISYAKYGSFFCDCGAKEDGSCLALTKRTASSKPESKGAESDKKLKSLKVV